MSKLMRELAREMTRDSKRDLKKELFRKPGSGLSRFNKWLVISFVFVATFVLPVLQVQARIYTWTDEQGITHYGDRVPDQYLERADNVEIKTNVAAPAPSSPPLSIPSSTSKPQFKSGSKEGNKPQLQEEFVQTDPEQQAIQECRSEWRLYERAQACIASCGSDTSSFSGTGLGRKLKCGCPQIEKPDCALE